MDDFIEDDDFVQDNKPEGLLNKVVQVIQQSRMPPFGGTSITSAVPTSGAEAMDFAKVAGRQIPNIRGGGVGFAEQGPMGLGLNAAGINKMSPIIPQPETQYGKNLELSADIAPWAAMGLEGGTALAQSVGKGVRSFVGKLKGKGIPELETQIKGKTEDIGKTKGTIEDLKSMGPQKVKAHVDELHSNFVKEFGQRLNTMKGQLNNTHFEKAAYNSAKELGATNVEGSPGNLMSKVASSYKGSPRTYNGKQANAELRVALDQMDPLSKAKFYRKFIDIISDPSSGLSELASAKADYAPIFDIMDKAKMIKPSIVGKVASDRIGPEQLAQVAEAEQTVGMQPGILEQADVQGSRLRGQQGELASFQKGLQDLITSQMGAKKTLGTAGKWAGGTALGTGLAGLIASMFKK